MKLELKEGQYYCAVHNFLTHLHINFKKSKTPEAIIVSCKRCDEKEGKAYINKKQKTSQEDEKKRHYILNNKKLSTPDLKIKNEIGRL